MSEIEAKVKYVKHARSLRTYGVSFFLVKVSGQVWGGGAVYLKQMWHLANHDPNLPIAREYQASV